MEDDETMRADESLLKEADIPFYKECWQRSGIKESEFKQRKKEILPLSLAHVMGLIMLDSYLVELIVDDKIDQEQKREYLIKYLATWAHVELNI